MRAIELKDVVFWADLSLSIIVGAFVLLMLFQRECVEFSDALETILLTFRAAIQQFAHVCAIIPRIIINIFELPFPKSDIWSIAFALAIFHQVRTLPTELSIRGRAWAAFGAFIACALLGASVSYCFGVLVSEPDPFLTTLFIALLYGLLEFVRYFILSLNLRGEASRRFRDEFRRRNVLYTIPYTLIGVFSAVISWSVFGTSPALIPFFAIVLFASVGFYILIVEITFQIRRTRGTYAGVPFLKSTRTLTVLALLGSCGASLITLRHDAGLDLFDLALKSCSSII